MRWATRNIPIPYARLVDQFAMEDDHADSDLGYEAVRRQSYARQMLDAFGKELQDFRGPDKDFRSSVLTPVLQRQLQGVPDCYAPGIFSAIAPDSVEEITISDTTSFYLSADPLDPTYIPSYRRNMVYIREVRWHLAILMNKGRVGDRVFYQLMLENHDMIMNALKASVEAEEAPSDDSFPLLSDVEVQALVFERIDGFFQEELKRVVCAPGPFHCTF